MAVPASQRVHRILRRLSCFSAEPCLLIGFAPDPGERLLGTIWEPSGGEPSVVLTNDGARFRCDSTWCFAHYGEIRVSFPEKSLREGALRIAAPERSFRRLPRCSELWEVGRFFVLCAADAEKKGATQAAT